MLPLINGKSLLECQEEDLKVLIENIEYRENEYIDYKQNIAYLEMPKGKERDKEKAEFKNDICAFANAQGGYILIGISEKNGCAAEIKGIDIRNDNTDKFELDRRNDLNNLQPKIPSIQFSFVKLSSEKYVVVIYVMHDGFSPYLHIVDEKNYKVYKRYGNAKKIIPYTELREMFNKSLTIEKSINEYTKNRINYYRELGESFGSKFWHAMFIPDTFIDSSYRKNIYAMELSGKYHFGKIFSSLSCNTASIPCVDGLRYLTFNDYYKTECYVKNNGIVEACLCLDDSIDVNYSKYPEGFFSLKYMWDDFEKMFHEYVNIFSDINIGKRIYICFSLVGCKNVVTESRDFGMGYLGKIDRDVVICEPIEYVNNKDFDIDIILKKIYISFALSIGVKHDDKLKNIINEVYQID